MATMATPNLVVFDLGNVLIDWDPRHLYRKIFADEAAMERFLAEVCSPAWNVMQDAGRTVAEATAELVARFPREEALIRAYYDRFDEMIPGAIEGTVAHFARLRERGVPCYALSNWSRETFARTRPRFPFLDWFAGLVISGEERVCKPDPAIFRLTAERFGFRPGDALFVDDSARNVEAAAALGFHTHHFDGADGLGRRLAAAGLV